jgi:hypothetical protein
VNGKTEDIPINSREAVEFVILTVGAQGIVYCHSVIKQASHEPLTESTGCGTKSPESVEILQIGDSGTAAEIALIKKLDGGLTAFASDSHNKSACDDASCLTKDFERGACSLGTPIVFIAKAAFLGLFFIIKQENTMDHWSSGCHGELAEGVADGGGDEIGMAGRATEDHPKADHGVRLVTLNDQLGEEGDLKGTGGVHHLDFCLRIGAHDFLLSLGYHRFDEFCIVAAGDNRNATDA